jgi:hypothetical protein
MALRRIATLALFGVLGLVPASAALATPNLDPFRRVVRAPAVSTLAQDPAATPAASAPALPATAPAPAVPVGGVCRADDQCPSGTICENGRCTAFEPPIHALLFRKDGGSTSFIPFYFSHPGNPGHRVVAPIYWHFWSPEGKSQILAPFYWHFAEYAAQRVVTVIPPYSHTFQPDAESWAVWPIFYKSTKFGWAAPLLGSFKIEDPSEQRSYGLYALLYFWKRNERAGTSFDLLLPLFVSSRSNDSAWTWALPLNFYWRNADDKHLLALPLFYWAKNATDSTLVTPLGYHSRSRENHRGSVAWLYWFGRKGDGDNFDVVFPLAWSFRSAESNTTIVPPVLHLRRPTYSLTTVFPIYWSGANNTNGDSWRLLVPLFLSRTREQGRVFSWLTPLGGYRRDDDVGTTTFGAWLPPMYFSRDSKSEFDMVLGLYWRTKDKSTGASTTLLGPFFRGTDPEGSTTTLFPLFWHWRDAASGATAHSLFPLYFRRSGAQDSLTAVGVFPLWAYYRSYHEGGFATGLFPLAFFGSRPDRGHGVLFPLFWHFRNTEGSATAAIPLFFRFADKNSTTLGIPPLLYFQGEQRRADGTADTTHVQFPLFWRFANGKTGVTTTVVPPLYYRSGPTGWSGGLFPLLFGANWGDRSHFVLAPLFWHFRDDKADKSTTVVLNYLHRRQGGETTDALFPLLHFRRGAKPGGTDETSFTLFPLVHYKRTADTRTLITPIGAATSNPERKVGLIPPYFWYQSRAISASGVPLLYLDLTRAATGKTPQERTRQFGPFIAVDSAESSTRALFPLFARYRDTHETGTWVFPTFFHRRQNDSYALDTFLPLFWRSTSNVHATTVVGPFYRSWVNDTATGYSRMNTGLAPLFVYARNNDRRFLLTPLFYDSDNYRDGTGRTLAALLFYRSTRHDGHTTVGFPLYWSGRTGPRSYTVLFPLFWNFSDRNEQTSTTIAGPFYASSTGQGEGKSERTRGLMPIAWYSRDDQKQTAAHAILPLFYEKHGPTQAKFLTLPLGWGKTPDSSFWYLLPIVRNQSPTSTFTTVFPLWFNHFNKATETSTTVIPPLAFFSRSRPDRSLTGLGFLFWHHRDIASSTNLALPLFYDVHNYHESRFTMLAPLFLRYWRASDATTYTVLPLFYRRASGQDTVTDSTTVAFPLFWDFKSADRRTTVLFPLFANIHRPTFTARYIFPSIYYRRGEGTAAGTSRLFIFPLWESAEKRPGDAMWEVLLGLFGYERIGRNRYVKVLFVPFQLSPAPAAQTAWYGRTPQRPRLQRRYGLDTKAW